MEKEDTEFDANLIIENLWLGSEDAAHSPLEVLKSKGISHVLVCGFGLSAKHGEAGIIYKKIRAIDLSVYNIVAWKPTQAFSFTGSPHCKRTSPFLSNNERDVVAAVVDDDDAVPEEFHVLRQLLLVISFTRRKSHSKKQKPLSEKHAQSSVSILVFVSS